MIVDDIFLTDMDFLLDELLYDMISLIGHILVIGITFYYSRRKESLNTFYALFEMKKFKLFLGPVYFEVKLTKL